MQSAAMEKGHLYKAEKPNYSKGQTGQGVPIGGKLTAKKGTNFPVGNDSQAKKLKKEFAKAEKANGRFPPF